MNTIPFNTIELNTKTQHMCMNAKLLKTICMNAKSSDNRHILGEWGDSHSFVGKSSNDKALNVSDINNRYICSVTLSDTFIYSSSPRVDMMQKMII